MSSHCPRLVFSWKKSQVEAAVIEVGLGGRLDATNILEAPRVVGITSLGLDHCHVREEAGGVWGRARASMRASSVRGEAHIKLVRVLIVCFLGCMEQGDVLTRCPLRLRCCASRCS